MYGGTHGQGPGPGENLLSWMIAELAAKVGIDADGLAQTIERFNGFARTGIDEDFHRGESANDKYYSDPTNKAQSQPRRAHSSAVLRGEDGARDLGTKGGVRTDVHARALRDDGTVIEGLYTAGNVGAPMMGHTYAGPVGTIGPAMAFGYLAALHIAGKN